MASTTKEEALGVVREAMPHQARVSFVKVMGGRS